MKPSTRPPLTSHRLDMPSICDICGNPRSTRKHAKCSQIRQKAKAAERAIHMADKAAKAQEGRRYAR